MTTCRLPHRGARRARRGLLAMGTLLLTCVCGSAAAQSRIAVVDIQRAINETEDGRKAKAQLKKLFNKRQKVLDKKQKAIKSMKEELEKQKDVLSKTALQKRLEGYQKAAVELQGVYVEYQRELAAKEAELTKGIIERMRGILRRIGQSQGYALIMERNEAGVMWVPSNLDLTDMLIQRYNAGKGRPKKRRRSKKSR